MSHPSRKKNTHRDADKINSGGGSEAAGSVTPKLTCFASTKNNTVGEGKACTSSPRVMAAVFTSLEPTPK